MAAVAIYISVHKNTQREINNIRFFFFHRHSLHYLHGGCKQINEVSIKSKFLISTADLRHYFFISFVYDVCNYNKKVSLFISLQEKL